MTNQFTDKVARATGGGPGIGSKDIFWLETYYDQQEQ